jgi:hypothetical protein
MADVTKLVKTSLGKGNDVVVECAHLAQGKKATVRLISLQLKSLEHAGEAG